MNGFASVVILDAPLRSLDRAFTYAVPEELAEVCVGSVVRVPFHGRLRKGIVTAMLAESSVVAKPIKAVLGPGLTPRLVLLAHEIAASCLSSESSALAAMVPERVKAEEAKPSESALMPEELPGEVLEELAAALAAGDRPIMVQSGLGEDRAALIARIACDELRAGGSVIIVLPESDSTTRTAIAVRDACGEHVAWIGSDRSARLRYRAWLKLRRGHARLAMGGRGAVLAPLEAPSLIIIDDEASPNLREGRTPRYDAVAVAKQRARDTGGRVVVFGTPPSIARRIGADPRTGRWYLVRGAMRCVPSVRIAEVEGLSPTAGTLRVLKEAQGRIVVLAHRGDRVEMAAERIGRILGKTTLVIASGSPDSDLALARRPDGPAVIVATPVIAEDHRIDGVSDVVILDADAALVTAGYRTHEDLFATWWRVLDATQPSRVILETKDRELPPVRALRVLDPELLAAHEAKQREQLGYPPYHTLVRISASVTEMDRVSGIILQLQGLDVIAPFPTGDDEMSMIVRAPASVGLVGRLTGYASQTRQQGLHARFEVDPLDLVESRWRS